MSEFGYSAKNPAPKQPPKSMRSNKMKDKDVINALEQIIRGMRARNEEGSMYLTNWLEDNRQAKEAHKTYHLWTTIMSAKDGQKIAIPSVDGSMRILTIEVKPPTEKE